MTPYSATGVVLEFEYFLPGTYGSDGSVEVSTNGGVSWVEIAALVVPVEVSIPTITYDQATRTLDIEVQAEFLAPVDGDLRLNCWVVEDTVVGSGSTYDQVNYYDTQPGHPFYGAGKTIEEGRIYHIYNRVAAERFCVKVPELAEALGESCDGVSCWMRWGVERRATDPRFAAAAKRLEYVASEEL